MLFQKYILFFFTFFLIQSLKAQVFKGTILNDKKSPVIASILLKETSDKDLIIEFFESNDDGTFKVKPQQKYNHLFIEIRAMGYATVFDSIKAPQNKVYNFDFVLKEEAVELQEIIVKTQKAVVVKKDTTEFFPNAFLNGTERKVEDLLKKLPGMQVAENGKLKYNGKDVQSVQLDGDDLFGSKYAIGTKNIPVDLIQKVQAIDNFNANPILKRISNSEAVSINLVFKKGKGTVNSEIKLGLGIDDYKKNRLDNSVNILAIKQKIKGFALGTNNNVGNTSGNSDYFKTSFDFNEETFETQKLLPNNKNNSNLNSNLSNINNEKTGSLNSFVRISSTISSKINFNISKDINSKFENSIIDYPLDKIKYNDETISNLLPKAWGIDTKVDAIIKKKGLLEIENNFSEQNISLSESIIQNNSNSIFNLISTKVFNQKNKILYTVKVKEKSAIQISSTLLIDKAPQDLISTNLKQFNQQSEFEKQLFKNEIKLISRYKSLNYQLIGGYSTNKTNFLSNYSERNQINYKPISNNLIYRKNTTFVQFKPIINVFGLKLNSTINLQNISQDYKSKVDLNNQMKKDLVLNTEGNLEFKPLPLHKIFLNYKNKFETLENQYLFENNVWNGNRSFQNNEISLDLSKNLMYGLEYRYHEPFNLITISLGANINEISNTYLSRYLYDSLFTYTTNFRKPINLNTKNYTLGFEKFLKIISLKYNFNLSDFAYKNLINNSELRSNNVKSSTNNLFLKSSFSNKFGVESTTMYNTSNIYSDNLFVFKFSSIDLKNKVYFRNNKGFEVIGNLNSINPNINVNKYFNFADLEFLYKPKTSKKLSRISFQFKNIFNTQLYTEFSNTDFSKTYYSSNLIPRYFMIVTEIRI